MTGACDAHGHVFGPFDRFPLRETPSYDPPVAPFERHREVLKAAGFDRAVIVQPAIYGRDHSAMYDAIARSEGEVAGVGLADDPAVLPDMTRQGVRALRFVDKLDPTGKPYAGSVPSRTLRDLAPAMLREGLHAEVWADAAEALAAVDAHASAGMPVVLDHMAGVDVAGGVDGPLFRGLLARLDSGNVWVKLTTCRASQDRPRHESLRPFHEALVATRPDRLVFGSDFPFIRLQPPPTPEGQLAIFRNWTPDPAVQHMILVDNPARLYGFAG